MGYVEKPQPLSTEFCSLQRTGKFYHNSLQVSPYSMHMFHDLNDFHDEFVEKMLSDWQLLVFYSYFTFDVTREHVARAKKISHDSFDLSIGYTLNYMGTSYIHGSETREGNMPAGIFMLLFIMNFSFQISQMLPQIELVKLKYTAK